MSAAAAGLPRIAALGEGTGLASLLRGLKASPVDITAIVTVADDGGSSGRLRRELGVLPPGDIRNCLVALADDESLMGRLFQHRFADGDLSGHPFGNLFLAALAEVTGSFDRAVRECSQVLKIRGRVLPSTLEQIRLWAERADGEAVCGETRIAAGRGPCRRVWLEPEPAAHPPALDAIREADLVCWAREPLHERCRTSRSPSWPRPWPARRAPRLHLQRDDQPGETDGFDAVDHLERVLEAVPGGVDTIVVHEGRSTPRRSRVRGPGRSRWRSPRPPRGAGDPCRGGRPRRGRAGGAAFARGARAGPAGARREAAGAEPATP